LYTSPLERTFETATIIADAIGIKPISDDRLIECDYGTWTGQELWRLRRKREWQQLMQRASEFSFPDGESLTCVLDRMKRFLIWASREHPGSTVAACSHADPIRAIATHAIGLHLDGIHRINVDTASISSFLVKDQMISIETLNQRPPRR
jgi:probable phosphoglycerate mutase